VRRLIVNADDLGLTRGVNRAIFETIRDGIVTSTTLMANSAAYQDALAQVDSNKNAQRPSVGCHVLLVDGEPLSPAGSVPSLLETKNQNGSFRTNLLSTTSGITDKNISFGLV